MLDLTVDTKIWTGLLFSQHNDKTTTVIITLLINEESIPEAPQLFWYH